MDWTVVMYAVILTSAALCGSVAVVTQFAVLTRVALGVVQAFETGTCANVAGPRVVHVDVVVTLAGHAAPSGNQGVSIVTWGTLITPGTWMRYENTGRTN